MPQGITVKPTEKIAYRDHKIGVLTLVLCFELLITSILHIFAFPWQPYRNPSAFMDNINLLGVSKQCGFLGILAFFDALNIWNPVKSFFRTIQWLFIGFRRREAGASYKIVSKSSAQMNVALQTSARTSHVQGAYVEISDSDQ